VIAPYPDEFVWRTHLRDGLAITMRPIRAEDEVHWQGFMKDCSDASVHEYFQGLMNRRSHALAAVACCIDYDREMAIVIEADQDMGQPKIIAIGRLTADADHQVVDYSMLVADAWQGRGVGTKLTAFCVDVARKWGVRRMEAQTASLNAKAFKIFRHLGFTQRQQDQDLYFRLDLNSQEGVK
jgi:acetyltransferase